MTFDDGIVGIYEISNIAEPGKKPRKGLSLKERFFFGYDTLGFNRYYTALQANQQIAAVINTPGWNDIHSGKDIAIMEDGNQYTVQLAQKMLDDNNLRITKLTLERIGEAYDVMPGAGA